MLGDATLWDEVVPQVGDLVEPRPCRIDTSDTVSDIADDVLQRSPERFAVAGHSLGGIIAMEIIRRAPTRVTRLAILNTSARSGSPEQRDQWTRLAQEVRSGGFGAAADRLATVTLPECHRTQALVARSAAMARTVGPDGFLRQLAAQQSRPDLRPSLAAVTVPTLVLSGALDDVSRPEMQAEIADRVGTAVHVVVPASGHMSPLEAPDAVAAELRRWLLAA